MTKIEFQDLLQRYASSTRQEADQVLSLKRQYPYSQLLHSLAARVSKDHRLENSQQELQLAAVYAADRHVLKELMSKSILPLQEGGLNLTNPPTTLSSELIEIDYADEVIHDLEILHDLKHNFEVLYEESSAKRVIAKRDAVVQKESVREVPVKKTAKKKATVSKKKVAAKKKTPVKAKPKRKAPVSKKTAKPAAKVAKGKLKKAKPLKKKLKNGDDLLLEIETSKRMLPIENPKQREQLQIIDNFIKTQPSISNAREKAAVQTPAGDLAPLRQGEFGDQIISETLVSILISQGKKEKAIEVLKKLIWKFPQKKAYFATQIEELKK